MLWRWIRKNIELINFCSMYVFLQKFESIYIWHQQQLLVDAFLHYFSLLCVWGFGGIIQDKYKHFIVIPTGSHFKIIKLVHSIHVTHIWTFPKYLEKSKYSDILSATQSAYRTPQKICFQRRIHVHKNQSWTLCIYFTVKIRTIVYYTILFQNSIFYEIL